jgi:urease accessory protein UreH
MHKNRLLAILATKSFSKTYKSGAAKASFLTETTNFSVTKNSTVAALLTQFQVFLHLF